MSETRTEATRRRPPNPSGINLAASWYIALASSELGAKPRELTLFDLPLVAWRDGSGRPVVMPRHCPHMGANLALGEVVDGCLRCPFHHWRFDASGACVKIPEVMRIPTTAHRRTYPTVERYGYIWVWFGSAEPIFELPGFPALEADRDDYVGFRFSDHSTGTVRHLLENAIDYFHFTTLHGLAIDPFGIQVLREQATAGANGPAIDDEAWFGVWIEGSMKKWRLWRNPIEWTRSAFTTLFLGRQFQLLVDCWPGGQRFTAYMDGHEMYKVLLGITPTGDRRTVQRGWSVVRKQRSRWRTLLHFVILYLQNRGGTMQDMPIYDTSATGMENTYVRYDNGLIQYRHYYQSWVARVDPTVASPVRAAVTGEIEDARAAADEFGLAAGWYVAAPSSALGSKPKAVDLFERRLVAWRDGDGRAVLMPRHCPHLNASLALGKVVDGSLRCPFHHWRFDASGACVEIPGVQRISRTARLDPYPVVERHGLVWAWHGSAEPLFPLPEFPALDGFHAGYLAYRFSHSTPASARRVLENAFDHYHFMTLHRVQAEESLRMTVLTDQRAAAENGPPIAPEAWFGALLESPELRVPRVLGALGVQGKKFSLLVDGWPGGQRLTFFLDGEVVAKELLGVSPIDRNRTVFQGWSLVRRTGPLWRDAFTCALYRAQHRLGSSEDLAVYRHATDEHAGAYVKYDHGVLTFRRHYQSWVDRVDRAAQRAH